MGFFSKKNTCPICGMEDYDGVRCRYCGKTSQRKPSVQADPSRFSKPARVVSQPASQPVQAPVVPPRVIQQRPQPTTAVLTARPVQTPAQKSNTAGRQAILWIIFFIFINNWVRQQFVPVLTSFFDHQGHRVAYESRMFGVLTFQYVVLFLTSLRSKARRIIMLIVCECSALLLLLKPLIDPVTYEVSTVAADGTSSTIIRTLSLTAETHLTYFAWGGILLVINSILFFKWMRSFSREKAGQKIPGREGLHV